ncbi:hypothetical protein DPMN_158980 [Dreissena polymorpha]|uniref:Uncharacterized protein n=1 Tax=Dreissena polymorpha TaxID=45954 RepID=A0A9D4END9_DREPO|nr:hypothetical protein DPMN_158980 [Dreissena polymorpha]
MRFSVWYPMVSFLRPAGSVVLVSPKDNKDWFYTGNELDSVIMSLKLSQQTYDVEQTLKRRCTMTLRDR